VTEKGKAGPERKQVTPLSEEGFGKKKKKKKERPKKKLPQKKPHLQCVVQRRAPKSHPVASAKKGPGGPLCGGNFSTGLK